MPIFLATLGLLAVVAIWTLRARYIARDAEGLAEVTRGVRTARQRFHVDRRSSRHPAETIDDPVILEEITEALEGAGYGKSRH